ncbi:hypothetical protein J4H92_07290 [Leucobacter weissii]|uniref:Uncharacterized protein n=1 Tax=Leucobacter weissii TaxID=1983706 RepID=A0A939SBW0_9MICO|nr:hypothetical protein [Leucobacter weissii]MBO1901753.1 hypothetical protein [Leucobacter weissii]
MTETTPARTPHLIALVAGIAAMGMLFALPGGIPDYLILVAIGAAAVIIGHRAMRRRGPLIWAAVLGLVLAYLELLVSAGLLAVRLTRTLAG